MSDLEDPDKTDVDPPLPADIQRLDGDDLAKQLLTDVARRLLQRVRAGKATAADLNVARALCKDQGIGMRPTKTNPLGQLAGALTDNLPFAGDPPSTH